MHYILLLARMEMGLFLKKIFYSKNLCPPKKLKYKRYILFFSQVWDDELALLAHFWSSNCEMMANENRHDQSTVFDYVGQINAASSNYTINLTSMVFEWYYEGLDFDYSQAACIDEDGEEQDELEGCERYVQVRPQQSAAGTIGVPKQKMYHF